MQGSQGCDTDCFGKIAGSILGVHLGPGHLEERWLRPFDDRFHAAVATFHEQSLSKVADRIAGLPAIVGGNQR